MLAGGRTAGLLVQLVGRDHALRDRNRPALQGFVLVLDLLLELVEGVEREVQRDVGDAFEVRYPELGEEGLELEQGVVLRAALCPVHVAFFFAVVENDLEAVYQVCHFVQARRLLRLPDERPHVLRVVHTELHVVGELLGQLSDVDELLLLAAVLAEQIGERLLGRQDVHFLVDQDEVVGFLLNDAQNAD